MSARVWSLFAWALVAASAVYWGLKLGATPQAVPAHATVAPTTVALRGDVSRVLGADPVVAPAALPETPVADARITLIGVVSPKNSRYAGQALALISIDGKPAKTYRVGSLVDGNRVLQAVTLRSADLGPAGGATQVSLNIAAPAEAARGRIDARAGNETPGGLPPRPPTAPPIFGGTQPPPQPMPIQGVDAPAPEPTVPGRTRSSMR